MNWLLKLKDKLNKNNNYWFRYRRGLMSKDLGYGFVPISWQGWIVVSFFVGLIFLYVLFQDLNDNENVIKYLFLIFGSLIIVILISWLKCIPKYRENKVKNN